MNDTEALADNGDLFIARDCDDCDGLVIERYMARDARQPHESLDDPDDVIDIPPALAEWFRARVNQWADSIKEAAKESL